MGCKHPVMIGAGSPVRQSISMLCSCRKLQRILSPRLNCSIPNNSQLGLLPCHDSRETLLRTVYLRPLLSQSTTRFPSERTQDAALFIPIRGGRLTLPRTGYLCSPLLRITSANPLAPTIYGVANQQPPIIGCSDIDLIIF